MQRSSTVETQTGRLSILEVEKPGGELMPVGVLLLDPVKDQLYVRVRSDWDHLSSDEKEILEAMEQGLKDTANDVGATYLLSYLQDTLSNAVRMSEPEQVIVADFNRELARLYRRHVPSPVRPFVTHLPRYSLAVAAGRFLENREVTTQYILRYVPDAAVSDTNRAFREVNVKVSLPDVKVRARKGYFPYNP